MARTFHTLLGAALAALSLAACNASGMRVYNLDELHTDDGYHRYSAVQLTSWEWILREDMGGLFSDTRLHLQDVAPKEIDDPNEACLEHLVELGRRTGEGGFARSQRIATYAHYVVACPWKLSRERCAILLGREGRDLGLRERPAPPAPETAVGAEELAGVLAELIAAARPALEGRDGAFDEQALAEVCARIGALPLDLEGARRALQLTALLERRSEGRFQALSELVAQLQRITVARALSGALVDRQPFERQGTQPGWGDPRVRGAAVTAWVQATGPLALAEFLQQLDPRNEIEVDMLLAILRGVAAEGLPDDVPGVSPADLARFNERWIDGLMRYALDHPDGRVRVAAMRALARVSEGGLTSLREEDWLAWIEARRSAAVEAERP